MRVISGTCRSLQLKTPKGDHTRPTQDRIKETLFNMINAYVPYSVFVDVFSGSGGIGIEALSRGAKHAYFLDNDKDALKCIEDNLKFTKLTNDATVLRGDFVASLSSIKEEHVDIIFADPPYQQGLEERLFLALSKASYVDEDTIIILEASIDKKCDFDGFRIEKEKIYKTNKHIFLRRVYE